jgi:hypothetical protein
MSTIFSLDEWFAIVERGTSGDQVYDILYSWKAERDELQRKLDIAVEAMRRIPHNANHTKHFACHGCEMDEALAEIEKVGKDE